MVEQNGYIHDIYLFERAYVVAIVGSCAVAIDTCLVVNSRQLHTAPLQQLRSRLSNCIHPAAVRT